MYLLTPHLLLLLLLLLCGVEAWPRGSKGVRPAGSRGRGRRHPQECQQYVEGGQRHLDCQDRRLRAVEPDWPRDTQHLLLARNNIQVLRAGMFSSMPQLLTLDLQQNGVSLVEDGAFQGLPRLTTLLLQHNLLGHAPEAALLPLPRLRYLRLHDNPWHCGCALEGLLRLLQLPGNRNLGNYARCASPPAMRGQRLKGLDVEGLCEGVATPPGPHTPSTGHPPHGKPSCHTYMFPKPLLDCRASGLKDVPAHLPSDLVKMDLSGNSIRQLTAKHFLYSKELRLLNLSSNGLDRIDTAAFSGLLHLRELDLSNNSLRYFPYGVLEDLYFLRRLSLGNNPWLCDYSIHYLVYWLKLHPGVEASGLLCAAPRHFLGWPVQDYVHTYNGDCPKDGALPSPGQGGGANEVAEEAEPDGQGAGQGGPLPRPLTEQKAKQFEIIRLS